MLPSFPARMRSVLLIAFATFMAIAPTPTVASVTNLNWNQLDQTLESVSVESNLLVAEFRGNSCTTIHERDADKTLAIASTFKLYVLGELSLQILDGAAAWDDMVTLKSSLRSMPSGDYAWVPAGTRVTVRDLAQGMIWQSDNTATDHLIDYLGRENVQKAFAAFGHSDPERNNPLLFTREMFAIKMTQSTAWIDRFASADNPTQLDLLATDIDHLSIDPDGGWGNWNGPTAIEDVEWFASANDLCRVTASLWTLGAQPGLEPVREILSGNRGAIGDVTSFPQAGYKGGYESGVVNMTYVLEREDGRVFFVSAGYNSTVVALDTGTAVERIVPVFTCLADDTCIGADNA